MSLPSLSVVMPNYNHGHFIREALEAVLGQSAPAREVLVVDDASTDDSREVVAALAARHPSLRLIRNEKNLGVTASGQRGLEACTGDSVAFLAADDRILPGHFERSLRLLARHPGAGLCSAMARMMSETGDDLGPCHTARISETECFIPPERYFETYERWGNWIVTFSTVYRRAALLEFGGLDSAAGPSAAGPLCLAIPARHGACFIPEAMVLWRKVDSSFSMRSIHDPALAIATIEAMDAHLRKPRFAGIFPPPFLMGIKRHALAVALSEQARAHPERLDDLKTLLARMPEPDLLDAALAAALRAGPAAGSAALKAYLFLREKPADRRRIAAAKLSRIFG